MKVNTYIIKTKFNEVSENQKKNEYIHGFFYQNTNIMHK